MVQNLCLSFDLRALELKTIGSSLVHDVTVDQIIFFFTIWSSGIKIFFIIIISSSGNTIKKKSLGNWFVIKGPFGFLVLGDNACLKSIYFVIIN